MPSESTAATRRVLKAGLIRLYKIQQCLNNDIIQSFFYYKQYLNWFLSEVKTV